VVDQTGFGSCLCPAMASNVEKVSVAIGCEELAWARARAEREGIRFVDHATDGRGIAPEALAAAEEQLAGK